MRRAILVALVGAVAGCGSKDSRPTYVVDGVEVHVESDAPWLKRDDTPERLHVIFDAARRFWTGDEMRAIPAGSTLTITGAQIPCGNSETAKACWGIEPDGTWSITTMDDYSVLGWIAPLCVEALAVVHEVGHGMLPPGPGNYDHADPRWADVLRETQRLMMQHRECFGF